MNNHNNLSPMETSILISKILGTTYLAVAIGLIVSKNYYKLMFEKFFDNSPAVYLSGMICVVLGWIMIDSQGTFNSDWTDIITVMSWLVMLKGVLLLVFPTYMNSFKPMLGSKFVIVLAFIFGLVFANFGFFM